MAPPFADVIVGEDYDGLSLLLAPSRELVLSFFDRCFRHRDDLQIFSPSCCHVNDNVREDFESTDEAALMHASTCALIRDALYASATLAKSPSDVAQFMAKYEKYQVKPALAKLVSRILVQRLPVWRRASLAQGVSLPKFIDAEWRVDIKAPQRRSRACTSPPSL